MIDQSSQFVCRKYAQAMLNVFSKQFKSTDVDQMRNMSEYLRIHHSSILLLSMPVFSLKKKQQFMYEIAEHFSLDHLLKRLIDLLIHDKRIFLLADILKIMGQLYRERENVLEFSISSYPKISTHDLEVIKEFLANSTGCAIIYTDYEDKNLIAGIRMQSATYLWEFSIAQQLRNVRKLTLR